MNRVLAALGFEYTAVLVKCDACDGTGVRTLDREVIPDPCPKCSYGSFYAYGWVWSSWWGAF